MREGSEQYCEQDERWEKTTTIEFFAKTWK